MLKNLDETVHLQLGKKKSIYKRSQERDYKGLQKTGVVHPHLASLSAASYLRGNECPGTHCSLILKGKTEDSSCQICQRVFGEKKNGEEDRARI